MFLVHNIYEHAKHPHTYKPVTFGGAGVLWSCLPSKSSRSEVLALVCPSPQQACRQHQPFQMAAASVPSLSARAAAYETQMQRGKVSCAVRSVGQQQVSPWPLLQLSCQLSQSVNAYSKNPSGVPTVPVLSWVHEKRKLSNNMKYILLRFSCCESSFSPTCYRVFKGLCECPGVH